MKIRLYDISKDLTAIGYMLAAKDTVISKMLIGGINNSTAIMLYEPLSETLGRETEQLERVKAIARELRTDGRYRELKNANQRALYLLDIHNVPKAIATDVIDYLKVMDVLD